VTDRPRHLGLRPGQRAGTAALEFALIAPVMVLMVFGTIELTQVFRIQSKLNVAAGQLAEMIAGQSTVTTGSSDGPGGTLGDMCTAASYNLLPFPTTTLSAYIESTTVIQPFGIQTAQDWATDRSCPSAVPIGSFSETITLTNIADTPRSLFTLDGTPKSSGGTLVKGYSAISLQLTYVYKNILPYFLGPSLTFTASAAARPRSNHTISCTYQSGSTSAPCPGVY
jgi:hypothetical protein